MKYSNSRHFSMSNRKAAVAPLFAFLLPALLALCALAINVSQLQLTSTELKIATDVAAHAGGRAMSLEQSTDAAWDAVTWAASLNDVAGRPLIVPEDENHIQFGQSTRSQGGHGRYDFTVVSRAAVDNGSESANSVSVIGEVDLPLFFRGLRRNTGNSTGDTSSTESITNVDLSRRSTATQVDRDIALILDRSGSMLFFKDEPALRNAIVALFNAQLIGFNEGSAAVRSLYNRRYSENVINRLYQFFGNEFGEYAEDWMDNQSYSQNNSTGAPRHSRWALMLEGVDAFVEVLEATDQNELVSLTTFQAVATHDIPLTKNYDEIHDAIEEISPFGGTAIGTGMETGLPPIISGANSRTFAAKTIVVLTDGDSNNGRNPADVVRDIRLSSNVTIHTVTFTEGAVQGPMMEVARLGGGRHYHAENGDLLIDTFEEIANNLPTVLTQ